MNEIGPEQSSLSSVDNKVIYDLDNSNLCPNLHSHSICDITSNSATSGHLNQTTIHSNPCSTHFLYQPQDPQLQQQQQSSCGITPVGTVMYSVVNNSGLDSDYLHSDRPPSHNASLHFPLHSPQSNIASAMLHPSHQHPVYSTSTLTSFEGIPSSSHQPNYPQTNNSSTLYLTTSPHLSSGNEGLGVLHAISATSTSNLNQESTSLSQNSSLVLEGDNHSFRSLLVTDVPEMHSNVSYGSHPCASGSYGTCSSLYNYTSSLEADIHSRNLLVSSMYPHFPSTDLQYAGQCSTGSRTNYSCSTLPLSMSSYTGGLSQDDYIHSTLLDPTSSSCLMFPTHSTTSSTLHSLQSSTYMGMSPSNPYASPAISGSHASAMSTFLFPFPSSTSQIPSPSAFQNMGFPNDTSGVPDASGMTYSTQKNYFWQYNSLSKGPKSENTTGTNCGGFSSPYDLVQWRDPIQVVSSPSSSTSGHQGEDNGSIKNGHSVTTSSNPSATSSGLSVKLRRGLSSEISPNFSQMKMKADNLIKLNEKSALLTKQISMLQTELTSYTTEKENRSKFRQQVTNHHLGLPGTPPLPPGMPFMMMTISDTMLQEKIESLEKKIEDLRGQKNQLASRTCRSRRSAFHEANKIKFAALALEHGELLQVLEKLRQLVDHARIHGNRPPIPHATYSEAANKIFREGRKHFAADRLDDYVHEMYSIYTSGDITHPGLQRLLEENEYGGRIGKFNDDLSSTDVRISGGSAAMKSGLKGVGDMNELSNPEAIQTDPDDNQTHSSLSGGLLFTSPPDMSGILSNVPGSCSGNFYLNPPQPSGLYYHPGVVIPPPPPSSHLMHNIFDNSLHNLDLNIKPTQSIVSFEHTLNLNNSITAALSPSLDVHYNPNSLSPNQKRMKQESLLSTESLYSSVPFSSSNSICNNFNVFLTHPPSALSNSTDSFEDVKSIVNVSRSSNDVAISTSASGDPLPNPQKHPTAPNITNSNSQSAQLLHNSSFHLL